MKKLLTKTIFNVRNFSLVGAMSFAMFAVGSLAYGNNEITGILFQYSILHLVFCLAMNVLCNISLNKKKQARKVMFIRPTIEEQYEKVS